MLRSESIQSSPAIARGSLRALTAIAVLAVVLAMTVPIYGGWLSGNAHRVFRYGFTLLWAGLAFGAARSEQAKPYLPLVLSLFGVSLGFAFAYLADHSSLASLGGSWSTPKGAAFNKILAEVIPVSAGIFLSVWLSRRGLESLGLRGGKTRQSLGLGLLATLPLLALLAIDPSGGTEAVLSTPVAVLVSWLPWIVLFSLANGFMEELWFRGLWLGGFGRVLGVPAAIHLTSVAFCAMHVIVYWGDPAAIAVLTPAWLFMGYAYALIVRRTGSLWGPVLAHAAADVLFLFVAFSTGRM